MYVDIFIAGVRQWYEFKCEEKVVIKDIIQEIYSVICSLEEMDDSRSTEYRYKQPEKELCLACIDSRQILNENMTFEECGIENGNRLILF